MRKAIYILSETNYERIYPSEIRDRIEANVQVVAPAQTPESILENLELLRDVHIIFSGWGAPELNEQLLAAAPNLELVLYGAGSVKRLVTDAFWKRDIRLSSAYAANAVPVAEFTVSQIIFSLKNGWRYSQFIKENHAYPIKDRDAAIIGTFGSTVGLISLGMIGRRVAEMLQSYDVKVIAYDPFVTSEEAAKHGVELCPLEDVFRRADIVSLHTPWLKETEGMITGDHFSMMKNHATFLNTARGAVVNEQEMIQVLQKRQDLMAVLDVTYPEPPEVGSLLYKLPNVVLTPHIAGSLGNEVSRMGMYMLEELERYLAGEPLRWEIDEKKAAILA